MPSPPESLLQRSIQAALRRRWRGCIVEKNHGAPLAAFRLDLSVMVHGYYVELEVKLPRAQGGGAASPRQAARIEALRAAGCGAATVRSAGEAIEAVAAHLKSKGARCE